MAVRSGTVQPAPPVRSLLALAALLAASAVWAQEAPLTRADTLRGSVTPERAWWDVTHYDLDVRVDPEARTVQGSVDVAYRVVGPSRDLQIDLQEPLVVDAVEQGGAALAFRRDGNAVFVTPAAPQTPGDTRAVTVRYHGVPRPAPNAPWDGGFVWAADSLGRPWFATAVQGVGASTWWPVKDTQTDEPDSQRVAITVPSGLMNVSNGRLQETTVNDDGTTTFVWAVTNPINTYSVAVNAGHYAHIEDVYSGEGGALSLDYYPLDYNADRARRQFAVVQPMLACFEHWFGPFPWYEDGFTLVETPFLGMEHQSAVAYGNGYQEGYLGRDLSGTGRGLGWDFIVVHESGHEWWGNSVTAEDVADMWVHESFTAYAENLFVECEQGRDAGAEYVIGTRQNVRNDRPVVGTFGVQREGSGDMYYKGANLLHTVRQLVDDDERWRAALRGLQATFRHQTVTGAEIRAYLSGATGLNLTRVFEQYLDTTLIPTLEVRPGSGTLDIRWTDAVPGFDMPVEVTVGGEPRTLRPSEAWQTVPGGGAVAVDPDYYVELRVVEA